MSQADFSFSYKDILQRRKISKQYKMNMQFHGWLILLSSQWQM